MSAGISQHRAEGAAGPVAHHGRCETTMVLIASMTQPCVSTMIGKTEPPCMNVMIGRVRQIPRLRAVCHSTACGAEEVEERTGFKQVRDCCTGGISISAVLSPRKGVCVNYKLYELAGATVSV
jgi:hypothetical protein